MKKLIMFLVGISFISSVQAHESRVWHKHPHKPIKRVVVVKPSHHHHANPWAVVAAVAGIAVVLDSAGNPKVAGKSTFVLETKLIESGKTDVIQQGDNVFFIKGTG